MEILLLEDEIPAAERLESLLKQIDPAMDIRAKFDTVEEAIDFLKKKPRLDLILSDVELADGLCFEIFKEVDVNSPVIFTTAYNQYAIRAFEANAIDYLLKPVKAEELKKAIEKYRNRFESLNTHIDYQKLAEAIEQKKRDESKRFIVKYGQKMFVVQPDEVAYFYSEQKSSFLVTLEGKTLPIDESLSKVEEGLDPRVFFRINRNFIVNLHQIVTMHTYSKGRLRLEVQPSYNDTGNLIVSAERSPSFRKWLRGE